MNVLPYTFLSKTPSHIAFAGFDGVLVNSAWDHCFKSIVTGEWGVKSDGDVEAPVGHFALVEIPLNLRERADMVDACKNEYDDEDDWNTLEPGWYLCRQESSGLMYAFKVESQGAAEFGYTQMLAEYSRWATEDEVPDCGDPGPNCTEHKGACD